MKTAQLLEMGGTVPFDVNFANLKTASPRMEDGWLNLGLGS